MAKVHIIKRATFGAHPTDTRRKQIKHDVLNIAALVVASFAAGALFF